MANVNRGPCSHARSLVRSPSVPRPGGMRGGPGPTGGSWSSASILRRTAVACYGCYFEGLFVGVLMWGGVMCIFSSLFRGHCHYTVYPNCVLLFPAYTVLSLLYISYSVSLLITIWKPAISYLIFYPQKCQIGSLNVIEH